MSLYAANGTKGMPPAQQKATALSRIASLQRIWDDEVEVNGTSSQETVNVQWSSSPDRPVAKKHTNGDAFWKKVQNQTAQLEQSVNRLKKARDNYHSTASSIKARSSTSAAKVLEVPNRPVKRKSDIMELSDSEDERATKRRQFEPPSAAASSTASLASTSKTFVKPWDQVHAGKKLPTSSKPEVATKPKKKSPPAEIVELSTQQKAILDTVVKDGKSVFFTGSAGTGKSVLLRSIIKDLRKKYFKSPDAVAITASTGIAACNIGGVTLHSFSGVGLGADPAAQLAAKVKKNPKATTRWQRTKVLIIDEISMLDGDFFDKLEQVAGSIRKNTRPFGGIQLVLTGDFFQLPPISKGPVKFAFNANCWNNCMQKTYNLTKVFRQKDQGFVDMLNEMRFGRLSHRSIEAFTACSRPLPPDGIEPTELFPRREDVDRANQERIGRLDGTIYTFDARDSGTADPRVRENALQSFMAPKKLQLRLDAQVMMIKNIDDQLVNGTVGKVVDFTTEEEWLKRGQPESLEDKEKPARKPQASPQIYPIVEWKIMGSRTSRIEIVREENFKIEGPNGAVEVSRVQLPLIHAWAMSIHKSQGQTLERVKVDLRKVFEKGQAYVAISRATSMEGLQIIGFQSQKVMAHPAVIEWSKTLLSA